MAKQPPAQVARRKPKCEIWPTSDGEEAISIVAKVMAIAYLDETGEVSVLNPGRELRGADVVNELLEVFDEHGLRPEAICAADALLQHISA